MITDYFVSMYLRHSIDPATVAGLHDHRAKILQVSCGPATLNLRVAPTCMLEVVHRALTPTATVQIPLARLRDNNVAVISTGDSEFLAALAECLAQNDLSIDAFVEKLFGPLAGSVVANASKAGSEYCQDSRDRLGKTITDWLCHESKILPAPAAAKAYAKDVDAFVAAVEKLRQQSVTGV